MKRFNAMIMAGLVIAAVPALAADGPEIGVWQKQVELGVNLLQSNYSRNWNGGDKGSVVWAATVDATAEKQFSASANWRNTLNLAYGQTHNQEREADGSLFWKRPDKTTDNVAFESLFRWTTSSGWDPFAAFNFNSLFEDLNADPQRPLTFNPLKFKESVGMSRKLVEKEGQVLMTRLGIAFIQNSRKYYLAAPLQDETETTTSTEAAAEMITEYQVGALDGKVDWTSKLTLSLPFSYSGKSVFEDEMAPGGTLPEDVADYTTALDVDFENTFTANITKVISVKLFVRWVYDKYDNSVKPVVDEAGTLANEADVLGAIRKSGQFKQTLALGFGYKFN
ncbi:MAG: DUF3078 domain-containing protein [bacterium]